MEHEFGTRLRHQREQRGVTLAEICANTKINPALLDSLERGDISQWPKGLFGRAYLRDYARAIGLDAEEVVSEFLALHPDFARGNPELDEMEARERAKATQRPTGRLRRALNAFTPSRTLSVPVQNGQAAPDLSVAVVVEQPEIFTSGSEPPAAMTDSVTATAPAIDLAALAAVCTRLARALDWTDLTTTLGEAAAVLDASGIIVWQWDPSVAALRATVAHGYAPALLARIPPVGRDDGNAVAAAYKSGERRVVETSDGSIEAVVIPAIGVSGCVAVLAIELRSRTAAAEPLCAAATILAAQLAMLLPG